MRKLRIDEVEENIEYVETYYRDSKVTVLDWGVNHIGFGQLVFETEGEAILDDEGMSQAFCDLIIKYWKEN